ncbi:hypothetical protein [Leptospira gomenensis]|uniref:hypothetical protein n=1 Tax=Leptospira gomenensis TaxID=2484974 RepID=UPI001083A4CA|nr:hypothetical protein [Leptospira gomenensis]
MSCSRGIPDLGSIFPFATSENQKKNGRIFPGNTYPEPTINRRSYGIHPEVFENVSGESKRINLLS